MVSILEGGYNLQAISDSAVAHVDALRQAAAAATPRLETEKAAAAATTTTIATAGQDSIKWPPPASGTAEVLKRDGASKDDLGVENAVIKAAVGDGQVDVVPAAAAAGLGTGRAATPVGGKPGGEEEHEDIDLLLAQLSVKDDDAAGSSEGNAAGAEQRPPL